MTTTWGHGDYPLIAARLAPAARRIIEVTAPQPGSRVIDVATGTGNAALVAAARGARVTGVDFEPRLLDIARQQSRAAGLEIEWLCGDVEALPIPDAAADTVVSVFGVMYAPDHGAAAAELARVTRPGGDLGLASWRPDSAMPGVGNVLAAYLPAPPASSGPPSAWGDEAQVTALLADAGFRVRTASVQTIALRFTDAQSGADFLVRTAGHVMEAESTLRDAGRWQQLRDDVIQFVRQWSSRGATGLELGLEYLEVQATRGSPMPAAVSEP
jgi:SAM-dependent methyltransferase